MQTEPSMRSESKEQMLPLAEDTIERAYKPLAEWFTVFPKAPCKVLPVPTQSENMHLQLIIFHLCQMDLEMAIS